MSFYTDESETADEFQNILSDDNDLSDLGSDISDEFSEIWDDDEEEVFDEYDEFSDLDQSSLAQEYSTRIWLEIADKAEKSIAAWQLIFLYNACHWCMYLNC